MAVRIQIPKSAKFVRLALSHPVAKVVLGVLAAGLITILVVFFSFYNKYAKLADEKLAAGPFPNSSVIYSSPESVMVGDSTTPEELVVQLRRSGYVQDAPKSRMGWFHVRPDAVEVFPGADSYFDSEPGVVRFNDGKIKDIISLKDNSPITEYLLEPRMISNLFDKSREKRRLVKYSEIPPVLVHAVLSIEDKRFFQHSGFDPIRIVGALLVDLREGRRAQGASTLTQQLARDLWLSQEKTWQRKFTELLITIHLERKLSKEQIFEYYANTVDLGRRGSFAIRGFGEASQVFFGKDLRQITLPEAAMLAGVIQRPNYRNPIRWPERARDRRNLDLALMRDNDYITEGEYQRAKMTPLVTAKQSMESTDAPYFVDLVNDTLTNKFEDRDFQGTGYRVYTTLDLELQHDAAEAVAVGMKEIEAIIEKRRKKGAKIGDPQCALICLDPRTGEVKALIGGKNYGASQLNHITAKRPSGSVFKPFVYATALNTGLTATGPETITPSSIFIDEERTFYYGGEPYKPGNYHSAWRGPVTLRQALARSMNIPTVEIAEIVGYNNVVDLARRAGMNTNIKPTPAMALGAYDVTPFELAGAYTVFANKGIYVKPQMISFIRDKSGEIVYEYKVEQKPVLDPRVNYLMVNLLQEVMRSGTGARVGRYGFALPAAGKTGSSHDGWFAGFTSKLLCVVWVGFDDYQDLKLDGGYSALPIWAEFMKRAHKHRAYRGASDFTAPNGLVTAQVDAETGEIATSACPKTRTEYYLVGTQPTQVCHLHGGGNTQIAGWDTVPPTVNSSNSSTPQVVNSLPVPSAPPGTEPPPANKEEKKKKGIFGKLKGIFK